MRCGNGSGTQLAVQQGYHGDSSPSRQEWKGDGRHEVTFERTNRGIDTVACLLGEKVRSLETRHESARPCAHAPDRAGPGRPGGSGDTLPNSGPVAGVGVPGTRHRHDAAVGDWAGAGSKRTDTIVRHGQRFRGFWGRPFGPRFRRLRILPRFLFERRQKLSPPVVGRYARGHAGV